MKSVPEEILKQFNRDSYNYLGQLDNKDVFELYKKKDRENYEEGAYTGFPTLIFFDGNIYSKIHGDKYLKALNLLCKKGNPILNNL